jgi:hypothetical protein
MRTRKSEIHKMICLDCHEGLSLRPIENEVIAEGKFEHEEGVVAGRRGSRPVVTCSGCGQTRNAILVHGDSFFATCNADRKLMEVAKSRFDSWRAEHEVDNRGGVADLDESSTETTR